MPEGTSAACGHFTGWYLSPFASGIHRFMMLIAAESAAHGRAMLQTASKAGKSTKV
jgi:hypothetical protein